MKNTFEEYMLPDIESLPLIALRGITVFPEMSVSFDVERKQSIAALEAVIYGDRKIFLVSQKDVVKEYPGPHDIFDCGVVCAVKQYLRTQSGGMRVMVEGQYRAKVLHCEFSGDYARADIQPIYIPAMPPTLDIEAMMRNAVSIY